MSHARILTHSPVVIAGGGLSGLAAAWELEQRGVPYTLIEVKARLGGSIFTERRATEAGSFVLDGTHFMLEKYAPWSFLDALGLGEDAALLRVGRYRDGRLVCFREGTGALVDALARQIHAPILYRMAVSSIGALEGARHGLGICLENGVLIEAQAVIIAAPARYAERMVRSLSPEAALHLAQVEYEPTVRVSLGYRLGDLPDLPPNSDTLKALLGVTDPSLRFLHSYSLPGRVPEGYTLVRAGVTLPEGDDPPRQEQIAQAVARVRALFPAQPATEWAFFWPEADPRGVRLPEHKESMAAVRALLPPTVTLIGSDYGGLAVERLVDARIASARAAAAAVAESLAR